MIIVIFLILFFFVTTKMKVPGIEANRPFYIYGLVLSIFTIVLCIFFNSWSLYLIYTLQTKLIYILFIILLFYFTISALIINYEIPIRQIKDQLYFLFWIIVFPLLPFFLVSKKINMIGIIYLLSKSVIIFGVASAILAYLFLLDLIKINFGDLEFVHQTYLGYRIHGALGEPTALSQLLVFSFLSLLFLKSLSGQSRKIIGGFLLISIVATGSRNAILCMLTIFLVSLMFEPIKYKFKLKTIFYSLALILILMITLLGIGETYLLEKLFFNRPTFDLNNKFSRLVIWSDVIEMITDSSILKLFWGHGAFELRREFGTAFNAPLEILYDYGIIIFIIFICIFFLSISIAIKKFQITKFYIYRYGAYLVTFGFTFSLFMTYFPTPMFQFSVFAFVLGFLICATPINYMSSGLEQNKSTNSIK